MFYSYHNFKKIDYFISKGLAKQTYTKKELNYISNIL